MASDRVQPRPAYAQGGNGLAPIAERPSASFAHSVHIFINGVGIAFFFLPLLSLHCFHLQGGSPTWQQRDPAAGPHIHLFSKPGCKV